MKCEKVKYLLPDYLRGMLTDDEMSLVAQHLHECKDCPRELASLQQLYARLDAQLPKAPADHYWTTLLPRIHERNESRRYRAPRWVPRFAFPLVALVLGTSLYLFLSGGPDVDTESGIVEVIQEMSSEEIGQLSEVPFAHNGYSQSDDVEQGLSGDKEVLETVLVDARNIFSYSELDVTSVTTTLDDQELDRLVVYLDQKRFVQ